MEERIPSNSAINKNAKNSAMMKHFKYFIDYFEFTLTPQVIATFNIFAKATLLTSVFTLSSQITGAGIQMTKIIP